MRPLLFLILTISISYSTYSQNSRLRQADNLLFQERYSDAIDILNTAARKDSLNSMIYYRLGRAYQSLQKSMDAIHNFEKAQNLDPRSTSILLGLGSSYFSAGMYQDSQHTLELSRNIDSTHLQTNLLLSKVYSSQKMYREALKIYAQLCKKDSINPYYHKQMGILAKKLNKAQMSMDELRIAYELNPRDISTLVKLISIYNEYTIYKKAIKYCNLGLDDYPNNTTLLKKKAMVLINLKWFENAQAILEQLVEAHQADAFTYKQLGLCYLNAKEYEKALSTLKHISLAFKEDPMLNLYMGIAYLKLKQYPKALHHLEVARFFSIPQYISSIYLYQARGYGQTRQFEKSVKAYQKHWEMDDSNPIILYQIATTFEEFGKHKKEALNYYSQFINQYKGDDQERIDYAKARILRIKENLHFTK